MDLKQKMLYCTIQTWTGVMDTCILQGKGLVWWCCRERKHRQNLQNNDTSGWIQQAEKMCLLMSDRVDAAPFSQLMLLLPGVSISTADWADMLPNFLPGTWLLSIWALPCPQSLWMNILWEIFTLPGLEAAHSLLHISALFLISNAWAWAFNRG